MLNPININLREENPIFSLNYLWFAQFKDDSFINQVDDDNTEHRFEEVRLKIKELKIFVLYNKNNINDKYIVDLENGNIYKNHIITSYSEKKEVKNNIRLIYFRRHRKYLSEKKVFADIRYYLGLQYLNSENKNCKTILQIDNNGNSIIGE